MTPHDRTFEIARLTYRVCDKVESGEGDDAEIGDERIRRLAWLLIKPPTPRRRRPGGDATRGDPADGGEPTK